MKSIRSLLFVAFLFVGTISIYGQLAERTEEVSSVKKKPAIIGTDKCKDGGMNYRMEIYDNGVSVIFDEHNNWFSFKTEYQINQFTGEKTNETIPIKSYIDNGARCSIVPLINSHKNLDSRYDLMIGGNIMTLRYKPLGITYCFEDKKDYTISTWLWHNQYSINDLRRTSIEKCSKILGPNNNYLIDYTSLKFKDISGKIITGGYYDLNTNIMYYKASNSPEFPFGYDGHMVRLYSPSGNVNQVLIDHMNNMKIMQLKIDSLTNISNGISEKYNKTSYLNKERLNELRGELAIIHKEIDNLKERLIFVDNVTAIYCIPSDEIVKITEDEKTSEIQYKNGDYAKISKLQSGLIYDCMIHRPNGIWKVKSNNNNIISEYVYTNELKGFIYKLPLKGGSLVKHLSNLDMLSWNMMKDSEVFDTAKNRTVHLRNDGKIAEYVKEAYEAKIAAQDAEKARKEKAAYQILYNKYSKSNVDELLHNCNIKVGMPFSMIKELCHWKIDIEGDGYKWYDVACSGAYLDENTNTLKPNVISVFVTTKLFWIRVEDGKVTFVSHH